MTERCQQVTTRGCVREDRSAWARMTWLLVIDEECGVYQPTDLQCISVSINIRPRDAFKLLHSFDYISHLRHNSIEHPLPGRAKTNNIPNLQRPKPPHWHILEIITSTSIPKPTTSSTAAISTQSPIACLFSTVLASAHGPAQRASSCTCHSCCIWPARANRERRCL